MVPVFDKDGRLVAYDGMVKNITERKRAEDALRGREERYRLLFNIVREAVFVHYYTPNELPGKFIEVNDVACQRYGYTREEFLRMGPMDIDAPEGLALIPDAMQRLTTKGWAIWEGMHLSKDGRKIPVEITNVLFEDFGEPLILSTARDITERKQAEEDKQRLEEQLRQAQKMEAVGQLSGGVAHDFNNVLSIIMGSGHLLLMEMDTRNPQRELVDQIISSSKKAASLTQSLLAFSRKQVLRKFPADINGIIATVQKLLGRVIGEDITFQVETTHDSVVADVDSVHIEQVLMNLATNARDAMPHGGRLSISSEKVTWDEDSVREQGFGEPGVYCCIAVSDMGQGMDAETRERIFEPFFTTKEVGKGTGLGLAMVYGIVKQHEGYITVDSEVAEGSTFKLYLPLIKDLQGSLADEGIAVSVPNAEEKTILLVEDDEMVRKVTTRMLISNGYTVMQAVDGEEAIKQIQDNKDKIDPIILDVIMPRKSGKEVYDTIRRMGITTKVLFMSGYPADTITSKGVLQEGMYFLSKPAPPKTLFQMIGDILNA
jgi:PAS domain S-box-containing protein